MRNRQFMRGLGLVEIMIGIVVIGIIAAVAAPSFSDMLNRQRVKAVAASLSTDMAYLRSEAMTRPQSTLMWMWQTPTTKSMSCYAIGYSFGSGDCRNCWDASAPCGAATAASATRVVQVPMSDDVSFKPSRITPGLPGSGGILTIDKTRGTASPIDFYVDVCGSTKGNPRAVLRVELNSAGRPHTCVPTGSSMGGYGTCTITTSPQCP